MLKEEFTYVVKNGCDHNFSYPDFPLSGWFLPAINRGSENGFTLSFMNPTPLVFKRTPAEVHTCPDYKGFQNNNFI